MAMCVLSDVSRSCGIASPNFAFDIRSVQLSLCNCACESQLMRPYLIFMLVPPVVTGLSKGHYMTDLGPVAKTHAARYSVCVTGDDSLAPGLGTQCGP